MTSPRQTNIPQDPALARWLEPLRDVTPTAAELGSASQGHAQDSRSNSGDTSAYQFRRADHIQHLSSLIRAVPTAQAQARRKSQWLWGIAAAAALTLAAGGTLFVQAQQPNVASASPTGPASTGSLRQLWGQVVAQRHGGQTEVLGSGAEVGAGDELSTTAEAYASVDVGRVRVDLSSATTVELIRTDVRNQAYRLRAGRVDVSVPHVLEEKHNIEVVTPNAVVRVRGTVFSVEVDSHSGAPVTRVQVTRGSVGVEHDGVQQFVNAGQSWSSAGATVGDAVEPEPEATKSTTGDPSADVPGTPTRVGAGERSSLRDQNQLFARALQAQRRGNHRLAAQLFGVLLKKYPDSPLAPSAQAELSNAQSELQRSRKQ